MIDRDIANCGDLPPGTMFPVLPEELGGGTDHAAEAVAARLHCFGCPVADECLEVGLREEYGVWGGLTTKERRRLRKQRAA